MSTPHWYKKPVEKRYGRPVQAKELLQDLSRKGQPLEKMKVN